MSYTVQGATEKRTVTVISLLVQVGSKEAASKL